jgi:hypothetical protein
MIGRGSTIHAFWGVASLGVLAVLVWLLALMVIEDLRQLRAPRV